MNVADWAKSLEIYWAERLRSGYPVLMLEEHAFREAARGINVEFDSDEAARDDFLRIARNMTAGTSPWRPRSTPSFLIPVAAQVYAAYLMSDCPEGGFSDDAYYAQLKNVLDRSPKGGSWSNELGKDDHHQQLWRTQLTAWVENHALSDTGKFVLPSDFSGSGRHVCLPTSQIALRVGDLARLPRFFAACQLRPDESATDTILKSKLPWAWLRHHCSLPGFRAWQQTRTRGVVEQQVLDCYRQWDGAWEIPEIRERANRRSAHGNSESGLTQARWWLGIRAARKKIVFRRGESLENSTVEASIEFARAVDTLASLQSSSLAEATLRFRYDDGDSVWEEVDQFEPGNRCLFAIAPQDRDAVERLLSAGRSFTSDVQWLTGGTSTEGHAGGRILSDLPTSVLLVSCKLAIPLPDHNLVDDGWHCVLRTPAPKLLTTGGLRFGTQDHWIAGAGPAIRIVGENLPQTLTVDSYDFRVTGQLFRCDRLSEPGQHEVICTVDGKTLRCEVTVSSPQPDSVTEIPAKAWVFEDAWPVWSVVEAATDTDTDNNAGNRLPFVFGNWMAGFRDEVPFEASASSSEKFAAVRLLSGFATSRAKRHAYITHQHPLVRVLAGHRNDQNRIGYS